MNVKYIYINDFKKSKYLDTIYSNYYNDFNNWYYNLYGKSHTTLTKKMTLPMVIAFSNFLYYQFPNLTINEFNSMHIREYIDFCKDGLNNHPKTVRKKTRAIKLFMRYLKEQNVYNEDFFENIVNPKDVATNPPHFKDNELILLFDKLKCTKNGYRDLLICKIILYTGAELSDILSLKCSDFNLNNKTLKLKTREYKKLSSTNEYLLTDNLLKLISEYLSTRKILSSNTYSPYLFLNKDGDIYGPRGFQRNFKAAIISADLPINYTSRTLRNTFMFNMAKVVEEEKLKIIAKQKNVKHYYAEDLIINPLHSLI